MTESQFVSLWPGERLVDNVECVVPDGLTVSSTLYGTGMYGLDRDGRPWILVRSCIPPKQPRWVRLTDFCSGKAAREWANV